MRLIPSKTASLLTLMGYSCCGSPKDGILAWLVRVFTNQKFGFSDLALAAAGSLITLSRSAVRLGLFSWAVRAVCRLDSQRCSPPVTACNYLTQQSPLFCLVLQPLRSLANF